MQSFDRHKILFRYIFSTIYWDETKYLIKYLFLGKRNETFKYKCFCKSIFFHSPLTEKCGRYKAEIKRN